MAITGVLEKATAQAIEYHVLCRIKVSLNFTRKFKITRLMQDVCSRILAAQQSQAILSSSNYLLKWKQQEATFPIVWE